MALELFESKKFLKICAPMVRYSKLPFRVLVRKYNCDLAFSPMIISDSFVKSPKARDIEFATSKDDQPLIVQFAANNGTDFANASELVANYCCGVDLNCGCPQRWATQEGYGACLINKPDIIKDVISQTRNRIPSTDFTVSIKIRLHQDVKETVLLCQNLERAGASFITVHGRTKDQRTDPVNYDAIKLIKENLSIPVVANGDVYSLDDANRVREQTGVDGVMAARGMLENPAMFAGYAETPLQCVKDWVRIALETGTPFSLFHHHLIYMCERSMSKWERLVFNQLESTSAVIDYLSENYFRNECT